MKTYQLTDQELQIVLQALGEVPLRLAGPLFTKLQQQFEAQNRRPVDQAPVDHSDRPM